MAKIKCENCVPPDRYLGCHGHCPEYLAYKKEQERIKKLQYHDTIARLKSPVDKRIAKSLRKLRRASYYE